MTDTTTAPFTTTVSVSNGGSEATILTVVVEESAHLDYTCPPSVDLVVTAEDERVESTIRQALEEDEAGALAAALLRGVEAGRAAAERRGYYKYLAEGEPDYGPPYEWQSDTGLSADARMLLTELVVDSDLVGRPAEKFADVALTRPLPEVLAELDTAGLLRRAQSPEGGEVFTAADPAWITAGSRRGEPFDLPGNGLGDALNRVEGFVRGDDVWPLRISDLATICAAARAVHNGTRSE
ncbi:hypothetical protein F8280_33355 [Micromonospora noduli]|uniref:hypothetical protein n=1 Tax=Micromonospora noduli TaxID=709876 RepID=UPI00124BAD60|nr:hypothetical protein [Micromonospora noduli]KAB1912368.1 hypothetical protein F8280_33355 [Micromonospora noduli]